MKKLFTLVFVALLFSVLSAGIKKTLYRDYGIVVFHPDSLISVRAHQIVWGNLWVIQSDSTDTMSMTPDVFTIDTVIVTDYLYSTDDVQFDSTLTFGSGAVISNPHADTVILTEGNIILTGKIRAGSFGTPLDVTSNRVYGAELHYYGNNYNVTALRARAQFKTTDATGDTAIGALIQAANNDGINASVLNGAKIEAIGKSTATGARIGTMRGLLVNTEWSAHDTITDLRILHLRTHTRDATADGCVDGTSYGLYIENEAVGGNGQALDAGIYLDGTNLSAGNKAFTYGADFSGVATDIGTADFRFRSGGLIDNPVDTFRITEAKLDLIGDALLDDVTIDSALTVECKAVFNDTVMLGDSADKIILPKGSAIELYDTTDTDKFEIYDTGTKSVFASVNPFTMNRSLWLLGDTLFFTDGGADTSYIVQNGTYLIIGGDNATQFGSVVNIANYLTILDNKPLYFGATLDALIFYDAVGQTTDLLTFALPASSNHMVFCEMTDYQTDWGHAQQTNPTIFLHSADATDVTQWISFTHDQTDGVIDVGTGDITLNNDVTLGDTINTVFLPKGTRLILADSSGADSVVFHNDGTQLSISSDNKITLGESNLYLYPGDTLFIASAALTEFSIYASGTDLYIKGTGADDIHLEAGDIFLDGKLSCTENVWIPGDTIFFTDGGADTCEIYNDGAYFVFDSDNNMWFAPSVYCNASLHGEDDAGSFKWDGYRWYIDYDNDAQMAFISFHNEDSIKVDTSLHVMEWTGEGGIHGDKFSSGKGSDIASATTIEVTHGIHDITGTTSIDSVVPGEEGQILILQFDGTAGSTGVVDGKNLRLAGNFVYKPNNVLTLFHSGNLWFEISRSDN